MSQAMHKKEAGWLPLGNGQWQNLFTIGRLNLVSRIINLVREALAIGTFYTIMVVP
jgi:hypothetical protein